MYEPLHVLSFDVEHAGDSGILYGTAYDLTQGCPACGTGSPQVSPLRIDPRAFHRRHHFAQTYLDHRLVSGRVRNSLLDAGECRDDLVQVLAARTLEPLDWYQILPQRTLPPFEPESTGLTFSSHPKEVPCAMCRRDGYFGTAKEPLKLVYSLAKVSALAVRSGVGDEWGPKLWPMFMHSWEGTGKSIPGNGEPPTVLALPFTVISARALSVLRRYSSTIIHVDPIELVP